MGALCVAAVHGGAVSAHESLPASLTVNEVLPQVYDIDWRLPATQGSAPALTPRFPAQCAEMAVPAERAAPAARVTHWRLRCQQDLAAGAQLAVDGLPATMVNVQVQLNTLDGRRWSQLASPRTPHIMLGELARESVSLSAYFRLGIEHILSGIDHLMFVLCLMVLVPARWRLVQTLSAFTMAHCATLALATSGVINLAAAPVEACIALSIVFLARDILRPDERTLARRMPWLVAFGFGLLHGLGFAGGLAEIGLPQGEIAQALLLFNLGVEAGQLGFVLAVSLLLAALRLRPGARQRVNQVSAYATGAVAAFWVVQRVLLIVA
ncbi:MAG: HupE/UreJ family protein [Pseudomonadota bacterium]